MNFFNLRARFCDNHNINPLYIITKIGALTNVYDPKDPSASAWFPKIKTIFGD